LTCSSFSDFTAKSKIPPKFGFARFQIGEEGGEGVEAFCFHDEFFVQSNPRLYPSGPAKKLEFSPRRAGISR
jgi:hypothetical protein